jgi:hypothetical protein
MPAYQLIQRQMKYGSMSVNREGCAKNGQQPIVIQNPGICLKELQEAKKTSTKEILTGYLPKVNQKSANLSCKKGQMNNKTTHHGKV